MAAFLDKQVPQKLVPRDPGSGFLDMDILNDLTVLVKLPKTMEHLPNIENIVDGMIGKVSIKLKQIELLEYHGVHFRNITMSLRRMLGSLVGYKRDIERAKRLMLRRDAILHEMHIKSEEARWIKHKQRLKHIVRKLSGRLRSKRYIRRLYRRMKRNYRMKRMIEHEEKGHNVDGYVDE